MHGAAEIQVKGILCVLALAAILWRCLPSVRGRLAPRAAGVPLIVMAVVSAAAYYNFGTFHGSRLVHYWEGFHYVFGSKYFPELGYDGLYAASLAAQDESPRWNFIQPVIRDLRTNRMIDIESAAPHVAEVAGRFSEPRWQEFLADHQFFLRVNPRSYLAEIRMDHGFNPPPSWTFVARLFNGMDASRGSFLLLASLDVVLLVVMFTAVGWAYGSRVCCLCLVLFGLNYPGRFFWIGGAFLRFDWLAAVVVGLCLLERKHYRWAGGLLGYASVVRLFPILFFFGPAVLALKAWRRGERPRWVVDLAIGLGIALVLGFGAGCLTGRGVSAWGEFLTSVRLHQQTWLNNNVGLDNLVLYSWDMMDGRWLNQNLPEPWLYWQGELDRRKEAWALALLAARLALLALLAAAAWRSRLVDSVVLGLGAIFAMTLLTCYYWIMLLILPLQRRVSVVVAALVLQGFAFGVHQMYRGYEMRYGLLSWGLAGLLVFWASTFCKAFASTSRNSGRYL